MRFCFAGNSNTGWTPEDEDTGKAWTQAMQALSHFSYDASKGDLVLCDLQGGIGSSGAVLTDPAISSQSRSFGATDLGVQGINTFFASHKCTDFCWGSWRTPAAERRRERPRVRFAVQRGTLSWSRRFENDEPLTN